MSIREAQNPYDTWSRMKINAKIKCQSTAIFIVNREWQHLSANYWAFFDSKIEVNISGQKQKPQMIISSSASI